MRGPAAASQSSLKGGPMPWGRSRGRGLGDITGWLVSPPPSPSTPRPRDSFKHSDCASETHHLNRHIAIVVAVAVNCGGDRVHLWICSTLSSGINPPTRTPSVPNLRCCFSQLPASELQYGSHVVFGLTRVLQGVTRRSSRCRQTHPQPRFPSPVLRASKSLCCHRLQILVVLS